MSIWTVNATVSVTVEADDEDEALAEGTRLIDAALSNTVLWGEGELEAFDYSAWEE